jgi:hypothetical protein
MGGGNVDISQFEQLFCDSREALEWARREGLSENAVVRSSAPAMLWGQESSIHHLESSWTPARFRKFQRGIGDFSVKVHDLFRENREGEEFSLIAAQQSVIFQRLVFKAACLSEDDFISPRLFLKVEGSSGRWGNNMNPPWEKLFSGNPQFLSIPYRLENDQWNTLNPSLVPWRERLQLGGVETVLFRAITRIGSKLPHGFPAKRLLIPNENELVIDTAVSLAARGVLIQTISPVTTAVEKGNRRSWEMGEKLGQALSALVDEWLEYWVVPAVQGICRQKFLENLTQAVEQFIEMKRRWGEAMSRPYRGKSVVLTNSPGSPNGIALQQVCGEQGIPVVAVQHGVTNEICATSDEWLASYDVNAADHHLAFNPTLAKVMDNAPLAICKSWVVGMPNRHLRMKKSSSYAESVPEIIYISTNLYKGSFGFFGGSLTDYARARLEAGIVNEVLAHLPHRVRYKTYPEENRRYADQDPVIEEVKCADNIELFQQKVDMRYLVKDHRILVLSKASSTVSWPLMSGKPVIFINWRDNAPLTDSAYVSFSEGMFLFDGDDAAFHQKLREFLSRPLDEIEAMWEEKRGARQNMIEHYFSAYPSGAGGRAAEKIYQEYFC